MKTITINRFDGGVAPSAYMGGEGQFSIAKHFDIHTIPGRLIPYRGTEADTTGQVLVGALLVGTDGALYGIGAYSANNNFPSIYKKTTVTGSWSELSTSVGSAAIDYNLLVEYKNSSAARRLYYAYGGTTIAIADPAGVAVLTTHALAYTNMSQGYVHPKDDILYIPYDNKIASYDAGANTWDDTALTLPNRYRITSICSFGNYLAIAATLVSASAVGSGLSSSIVYLWDRDGTVSTVTESVDWGVGRLQVLNNLDGVLIGITDSGGASSTIQDMDSIQIKGYAGGAPYLIAEIPTIKQSVTDPDAAIEPRVNFIYRGKMHFSASIDGGGSSPDYRGIWTVSKSKVSGQYAVNLERMATNDGSETGVIAAAILGDYAFMVHTAEGTLTRTIDAATTTEGYTATSFYESLVNPGMPLADKPCDKKLMAVACHFLPLPTSTGAVTLKYRVDGGSWTTIKTHSTDGDVYFEMSDAAGTAFTDGRNFEFRLESIGFAEIISFSYRYSTKISLINPTV